MKRFAIVSMLLLVSLCGAKSLSAQNADVSGTVTDQLGAVVPRAKVRLVNQATMVERNITTNAEGIFSAPFVNPGLYQLFVEAPGFSSEIIRDIKIDVAAKINLPIHLQLGRQDQTVRVDGSGLTVNTVDGSVSTLIDRQFVENVPLNGRSFQDLILLTPGVVTNSPQTGATSGYSGEFSVNGQRTESNAYSVDGVSANTGGFLYGYGTSGSSGSVPSATALGTTQSLVSVDALQEFRVASSSYSAEYGLSPGGQFSFSTRSGSKELHGTAFDYLRNNYFDANDWFNDNLGAPQPALRQNDFGGTFGGPIWIPKVYDGRSRSFLFFSYEGLRLTQPQAAIIQDVPSTSLRQNAPTPLQAVLNALPPPTGPDLLTPCDGITYLCPPGQPVGTSVPSGLASFVQTDSVPSNIDSTSIRFDQQITSKLKAFFRFSDTQSAALSRYLSTVTSEKQSSYTNTLGITASLSSAISDEFRLNYTSNLGAGDSTLDAFGGAKPTNLLTMQGLPSTGESVIALFFPGYSSELTQGGTIQPQHSWDIVNSITLSMGRQLIKLGIDHRQTASRLQRASPDTDALYFSSGTLLANSADISDVYVYGRSYPSYTNTALYAQDEIRLSTRVGISAGLRWEVNPPPGATSGSLPYTVRGDLDDPSSLSLGSAGARFWRTTYYNFAPRFGVAYQAHNRPGSETVIRVGGGVFFDSGQQNSTQAFGNSPGQANSVSYFGASFPLTPTQLNISISDPPVGPYSAAYYFPPRLQLPYTLQWNFSLEQSVGRNQSVTLSYVGANGKRLLAQQLVDEGKANPDFPDLYIENSGSPSNYNALQIKFQRTISRGLQILGSYNWSHSIDYGSQDLAYAEMRGNSDFDLRQSFNAALGYDLQANSSNRIVRSLIRHWGVDARFSARTGFPVSLNGNTITDPNGQAGYSGLNTVANEPIYIHVPGIAGNRQINPAAFTLPSGTEEGDAPRNFARGFGTNQADIAFRRTFPITGQLHLQFRAESFNALNHPNFGYINPTYGNAQFGEATKMLNQSLGGLSPLYQQGGPRSMQFAMKLVF